VADQRISQLTALLQADVDAVLDQLPIADTSTAETKKVTPAALVLTGVKALPAGTIPGSAIVGDSITAAQIAANAVGAAELADGAVDTAALQAKAVTAAQIADDTITAAQIAANAVTASELADGAVDTAALVDGAVTQLKLAADSVGAAQIQANAVTALELADGAVDTAAIVDLAVTSAKIANDAVTAAQIATGAVGATELAAGAVGTAALADGAVTAAKIANDSITAAQIAPDAVGASELADNAVDTGAIADGAVTSPKIGAGAVGTTQLAAGGVTSAKVAGGAIGTTQLADGGVTAIKLAGDLGGAAFAAQNVNIVLAGPATGGAGKPTFRALISADLPAATATSKGAVSLLPGGGLSIGTGGELSITNAVVAATNPVVTYDSKGLVTGGRALVSADLPKAAAGAAGGVVPGAELTVATPGTLDHVVSAVVPGVYSKVTVNQYGHITAGTSLQPADVPALDASKINSGTLDPARLQDRSITQQKLADYALAYIQEAVPPAGVNAHPIGMTWLQESTGQVSVWNGNSWMKTGASTLFNKNLRYGGSYNATTGAIMGVTQFGTAEGVKVGDQVPAADDKIAGLYFVAATAGTNSSFAGGAAMDAGDWLLCHGTTGGWVRIDTLSGAGGGGGSSVSHLTDLLDVTLTVPSDGDFMQFNAAGQWVNVSVLDEGTWT